MSGVRQLLHRLGIHRARYVFGNHNRYFECEICGARMVKRGLGGYQPVDIRWLRTWMSQGPLWHGFDGVWFKKPLPDIEPDQAPADDAA